MINETFSIDGLFIILSFDKLNLTETLFLIFVRIRVDEALRDILQSVVAGIEVVRVPFRTFEVVEEVSAVNDVVETRGDRWTMSAWLCDGLVSSGASFD